jgi:hypothetical protein
MDEVLRNGERMVGPFVNALMEEAHRIFPAIVEWRIEIWPQTRGDLTGRPKEAIRLLCSIERRGGAVWETTPEFVFGMADRLSYLAATAVYTCCRTLGLPA